MTLWAGPHRLAPVLGMPRSTIGEVMRRHGLSRLRNLDRASGLPISYVRERPGEVVHLDVKKLGRIPAGGGHRFRGRGDGTPRARAGSDYVHVAIDDASRVAYVAALTDEPGPTCARFLVEAAAWFAGHGARIARILTDKARNIDSAVFAAVVRSIGARHKRTRPFRPQANCKAERFIQTMLAEWAHQRGILTNDVRLVALAPWLDHYNHNRAHTAVNGETPMAVMVSNVSGNHT